ncbi:hypothetical protein A4X06_0g736 [Tilletia controversa]|uniref:Uncharacterized protein n=2 Tax=Tilletia TaxID=13289 RepID=A0A8X7N147_9BASI|nr:hypothetical protein CF336_g760 [Tilletia laevis]KAE8208372.1 hypothetical protein CF335_g464 [Tilletia laevis]KAE8254799.1 hypothetical protein A4X06_0g736 [Tilletia controversa]KAE8264968.1 hypothetical protein A4X03_0g582 [Tilletia caries]
MESRDEFHTVSAKAKVRPDAEEDLISSLVTAIIIHQQGIIQRVCVACLIASSRNSPAFSFRASRPTFIRAS